MVALLATVAALAAFGAALLLRRRGRGGAELLPRLDGSPAGLKHLATTVSDLSDLGLHLAGGRRSGRKPRLGALLGPR